MPVKVESEVRVRFLILASPHAGWAHKVWENMFTDVLQYNEVVGRRMLADDVVMFDGGTDVGSKYYGETRHPFSENPNEGRDTHERKVFIRAQAVGAACIGVCRGSQFLTVMSGGKLIQHVTNHGTDHHIITNQKERIFATSTHHQQMWPYDTNHELLAWADHNAESFCEYGKDFHITAQPEVVWYPDTRSLCIQGHPEYLQPKDRFHKYSRELVEELILKEKA